MATELDIDSFPDFRDKVGRPHELELAMAFEQLAKEACERLVVFDNHQVFALVGNANNPQLQADIHIAKGDARGTSQPVGWTVPFEHSVDLIDKDKIADPDLQKLVDEPDTLTSLGAGLFFVRAIADRRRKIARGISDAIIPPGLGSLVQLYSPEGVRNTQDMIDQMLRFDAEPVMTSANFSKQNEIVHPDEARDFAEQQADPLQIFIDSSGNIRPVKPKGSYTIVEIDDHNIVVSRQGWLGADVIANLFSEYSVIPAPDSYFRTSNYPEHVLTMADLPPEVQELKNEELRLGILAVTGMAERVITLPRQDNYPQQLN